IECAVSVSQQRGDSLRGLICDCQVGGAVAVEIRSHDRKDGVPGRVAISLAERSVSIAEQYGDPFPHFIVDAGHRQIRFAIVVEIADGYRFGKYVLRLIRAINKRASAVSE